MINENCRLVLQQVLQLPLWSLCKPKKLNLSDISIFRIFKNLEGYQYWIQLGQCWTEPNIHSRRISLLNLAWHSLICIRSHYCWTFLIMMYNDLDFLKNVWFFDKSHIHLDGYINWQTTRFLGIDQPDVIMHNPLYSTLFRTQIWCAVSALSLWHPISFKMRNAVLICQPSLLLSCKERAHK